MTYPLLPALRRQLLETAEEALKTLRRHAVRQGREFTVRSAWEAYLEEDEERSRSGEPPPA